MDGTPAAAQWWSTPSLQRAARPASSPPSHITGAIVAVVEPQGERDALAGNVDVEHLHRHDVTGLHHVTRVLDEGLRHGRDVNQAVLVHTNVDKRAEGGDIGDDTLEQHAGF